MAITVRDPDLERLDKIYEKIPSDELAARSLLNDIRNKAVRKAIAVMVKDLYDLDEDILKRDLARITLADWEEDVRPEPEERQKLLRVLWWIFGVYFNGDYGKLLSMCIVGSPK